MARNIEIKAHVADFAALTARAAAIADEGPVEIRQDDTFFACERGRLGRTRIHLDEVEGLGDFMELEVVLREGESAEDGVREAESLMARLQVKPSQLIDRAYIDLLAERR